MLSPPFPTNSGCDLVSRSQTPTPRGGGGGESGEVLYI